MSTVHHADHERLRRLSISATRAFVESGLRGMDAEVVVALDTSRTMAPMYLSGGIQQLVESLLALALGFDDDGVVPTWVFGGHEATLAGTLDREEFAGWVARNVDHAPHQLSEACHYAPLVAGIVRRYFPIEASRPITERKVGGALKKTIREYPKLIDPRPFPIFVIVVTGGECADPTETIQQIRRASQLPIFFQFAGISPAGIPKPEFAFLERLDRLSGRWVDNCGFFAPRDFTDPRELFGGLLNEFPSYLELARVQEMLIPPPDEVEAPSRPPTAVTMAIPDDVDDDVVLTGPSDEEILRRERERAERQRRRLMRARAESAGLPTDRDVARPRVRPPAAPPGPEPPPVRAHAQPARPEVSRPPALTPSRPPRTAGTRPHSEQRAHYVVPAPAPPSVRATKPPSGRTPRRVPAPPPAPRVAREPTRPPRASAPSSSDRPPRTARRASSIPGAPPVRQAPPVRETSERAARRPAVELAPPPRVENPTPRPTPRTPPPALPPNEPTLRNERPTPRPRDRPSPPPEPPAARPVDRVRPPERPTAPSPDPERAAARTPERVRPPERSTVPIPPPPEPIEQRPPERERPSARSSTPSPPRPRVSERPPERPTVPAEPGPSPAAAPSRSAPSAAPSPSDEDPAVRLARIRARRAARRAAQESGDDDPTAQ